MTSNLRFDDKVVIVTGSGAGLGRAYALLFGSRGAKVVVNDLGGSSKGEGSSTKAADVVVDEIKAAGGIAVADYNSVEDGDKVIQTALDHFGKVDILVNNAGILRDRSLARTSDTDWDLVHRVHLRGSFLMTRAAFPHMKKQGFGRIIMTSSVAGIYGNFGQSNYSAAKLGLLGLSNTVAIEGRKYNVYCNTIAPMGGTRLTEGIIPEELFKELKPEFVAPLVAWLCHEDCQDTGGLYEAGAGWYGKYRWERTKGHLCRNSLEDSVSIEDVKENWDKICDFSESLNLQSNEEAAGKFFEALEHLREKPSEPIPEQTSANQSNVTGPMSILGATDKGFAFTYDADDAILYALGVGISTQDENYLKFLYEGSADFSVLPSFLVVCTQGGLFGGSLFSNVQGWNMDLTKLLHGEQYIEVLKPLPSSATLSSDMKVSEVLDKGSGAVIVVDVTTYDEQKELIAKSQWSLFMVGDGNFNGPRKGDKTIPLIDPPNREPDYVEEFQTSIDQAALYRLSGDKNPLHIDPDFAALGGFPQPILHGLCSYGVACRTILKKFCNDDVTKFKAMKSRFNRPVTPGQKLITEMWKENNRIFFSTYIHETKKKCLSGGYVDIISTEEPKSNPTPALKSTQVFDEIKQHVDTDPSLVDKVKAVIIWNINTEGKLAQQWTIDLSSKPGKVISGPQTDGPKPALTLTIEDEDMVSMSLGKLNPQKAFMQGKLKISGNLALTQKLAPLLKPASKI